MFEADKFFNTDNPIYKALFSETSYAWEALARIEEYINSNIRPNIPGLAEDGILITQNMRLDNGALIEAGAFLKGTAIELGPDSVIESGAYVISPVIIGSSTNIRQGAYVRGKVIVGNDCVVGHATEMKNSVMLGDSKAGHFAYIGDSLLGSVNLGAGTKLANLKVTNSEVVVKSGSEIIRTGLRKFGAILADGVETGCNSVTAPGTILGKNAVLYPNTSARGYYPDRTIVKLRQKTEQEVKSV